MKFWGLNCKGVCVCVRARWKYICCEWGRAVAAACGIRWSVPGCCNKPHWALHVVLLLHILVRVTVVLGFVRNINTIDNKTCLLEESLYLRVRVFYMCTYRIHSEMACCEGSEAFVMQWWVEWQLNQAAARLDGHLAFLLFLFFYFEDFFSFFDFYERTVKQTINKYLYLF